VGSEEGSELIVATDGLDDTWWENFLGKLNSLETSVWGEGTSVR
jgi:hypothetical protein